MFANTKRFSLRLVLTLVISLLGFGVTGVVTLTIGEAGIRGIEDSISVSLSLLADQMQDKLDRRAFGRVREIGNTARLFGTLDITGRPDAMRRWLEQIKSSADDYAWIGFANTQGRVVEATGGARIGEDVSQLPWFRAALQGSGASDVPDNAREKPGAATLSAEAGQDLDIGQAALDANGQVVGVLGAQVNWSWVGEIRDSVIGSLKRDHGVDVIVLNPAGVVILGPRDMLGRSLHIPDRAAPMAQDGAFQGRHYLFAYAKGNGYRDFGGLGWSVLVRQDAQIALAPVRKLQNEMTLWGLGFSILAALAAWTVAGRIAAPLLRLAGAAQNIRQGVDMQMPEYRGYAEAEVLSRSLASLVSDLKNRERDLAGLNETLELQVLERTRELAIRNDALTKAYAEAEKATRAKSRFLAAASHDLRQPLHAMSLFARALSRRVSGDEAPRLVSQLEEALASLREMFEALLNISRLDAGLIQPNVTEVSAKALVERVASGFHVEAEGRHLRFVSRSTDAQLRTDPALVETMLRNLISNALKFTRHGGVALIARRSGDAVAFEVVDTGPGIAEDRRERVFDEFERAREQASGHNEGLGLGLSIVRRYAALLGITIALFSRPGHGTRFSLTVPEVQRADRSDPGDASHTHGAGPLPVGLRIMVIDDDPMIVSALMQDLADRGCKPQGATSAAEAEAILNASPEMEAMIVDYDLGCSETGPELLHRMERKLTKRLPGLILTGGTDSATLTAIIASDLPWLTKPAEPEAIVKTLAEVMAKHRAHCV
jgi:signal transduction histidine kinase/CheY-like chemotaxis protein